MIAGETPAVRVFSGITKSSVCPGQLSRVPMKSHHLSWYTEKIKVFYFAPSGREIFVRFVTQGVALG